MTIRALLFNHEKDKVSFGDFVKVLLDELDIKHDSSGSTTLRRKGLGKGVEPDDSFYIQNYTRILAKDRIDLIVDPPPDLAVEIDLTSKTQIEVYEALSVPELWRYDNGHLRIDILKEGKYVQVEESPTFPGWPITYMLSKYITRTREVGRSKAIKELISRP
ncbi:MAG: Uma2 family endonuclease [Bacteroidota bacterium]